MISAKQNCTEVFSVVFTLGEVEGCVEMILHAL